jgi:hypothetical protein
MDETQLPPGHPPTGGEPAGGEALPAGHPPTDGSGGAAAADPGPGGQTLADLPGGQKMMGPFALTPPKAWTEKPTASSMRAAQWSLPGAGGAADAELVVYYFGTGGAGGVDANLDRWVGQFQQADGTPMTRAQAKIAEATIAGQKATTVEVGGRYATAMRPGAAEQIDEAGWHMTAAIVESPEGPYYFKLVGPEKTVKAHKKALDGMLGKMALAK